MTRIFLSLFLGFAVASTVSAGIVLKSTYMFDQQGVTSFDGSEDVAGNIDRTINLPNANYIFDLGADSSDVYELRSRTQFEVEIDGRAVDGFSGDGWWNTRVRATNATQLVDTAFVEGVEGDIGGVVEFLWDVTGSSQIMLDSKKESDAYRIEELYTTALFTPLEEQSVPDLFVHDESNPPFGTKSVDSSVFGYFEPVSIFVDWFVGEELDVFFELQTTAELSVKNVDAAGFSAMLLADFTNTATMKAINIYNQDGVLLEDARLVGQGGFIYDPPTAIPEPTGIYLLIGLAGLIVTRRCR